MKVKLHYWLADRLGYDLIRKHRSRYLSIERHLAEFLSFYSVNCVIDVGANAGQYAESLRRFGYAGRIVSFEPVAETFKTLSRNAAPDPEWVVHAMALGRKEGTMPINVTDCSRLSSFLTPSDFGRQHRSDEASVLRTEEVSVQRLDGLFDKIVDGIPNPVVFLKMDTQGFDLEVFAGAAGCLDALLGLQSELSVIPFYGGMRGYQESLAEYRRWGFVPTGFYPLARDAETFALVEMDCVMVRLDAGRPSAVEAAPPR